MEHKEHLVGDKRTHYGPLIAAVLILAGLLGWEAGTKRWGSKIGQQLLEAATLVCLTYFKKLVMR